MPKEYLDCVAALVGQGKSKADAQKICAVKYYKKHGKTPSDAEFEFAKSLYDILDAVRKAVRQKYETPNLYIDIVDVYPTYAVIKLEGADDYTAVDWSFDEQQNVVLGAERRVEKTYTPVGLAMSGGGDTMTQYEIVEREAKIFEAGDYPDKGLTVTEAELEAIVQGFTEIPIKVEHVDSPLVMGKVKSVWRKGKELFGKLAFPKAAWELLEISGAKKLSSSIKRDKSGLLEVSVVRNPRVVDAAVYSVDEVDGEVVGIRFESDLPEAVEPSVVGGGTLPSVVNEGTKEGDATMSGEKKAKEMDIAEALRIVQSFRPSSGEASAIFDASNAMVQYVNETENELKATAERALAAMRELQKANAERLVEQFKREGKVTPAAEKFAKAILLAKPLAHTNVDASQVVTFTNDAGEEVTTHFADMFCKFLEALPPVISFQELARQKAEEEAQLSADELEFLAQKLGLTKEQVLKSINR